MRKKCFKAKHHFSTFPHYFLQSIASFVKERYYVFLRKCIVFWALANLWKSTLNQMNNMNPSFRTCFRQNMSYRQSFLASLETQVRIWQSRKHITLKLKYCLGPRHFLFTLGKLRTTYCVTVNSFQINLLLYRFSGEQKINLQVKYRVKVYAFFFLPALMN